MKPKSIFVFEWFSGGGLKSAGRNHPLFREGLAMLSALVEDIVACPPWKVHCRLMEDLARELFPNIQNHHFSPSCELSTQLNEIAAEVDFVLIIAPETDNALSNCLNWTLKHHHKLVSPALEFACLTANKLKTFQFLNQHRIPTIPTRLFQDFSVEQLVFGFPIVVKPIDGAGGQKTHVIRNRTEWARLPPFSNSLVQPLIDGTAASICVLTGEQTVLLPPARQVFSGLPLGEFSHAAFTLTANQVDRATSLARKCIKCLPPTCGFFGIDLILGRNPDGTDDVVCEINPRLTSSYLDLRKNLPFNLAEKMLAVAVGNTKSQADAAMSNKTSVASLARSSRLSTIKYSSLE